MKTSLLAMLSLSLFPLAAQAQEAPVRDGTAEGNGGIAKVCRTPNGAIRSAELLDIYEGRVLPPQLTFAPTGLSATELVHNAILRMVGDSIFLDLFVSRLAHFRTHQVFLPHGTSIVPTDDAYPVIQESGCDYENVASYQPDGSIQIDRAIFAALSPLNRAALELHETIYEIARTETGATHSVRTRQLVALLLAREPGLPMITAMLREMRSTRPPEGVYRSEDTVYRITHESDARHFKIQQLPESSSSWFIFQCQSNVGTCISVWTEHGNFGSPNGAVRITRTSSRGFTWESAEDGARSSWPTGRQHFDLTYPTD